MEVRMIGMGKITSSKGFIFTVDSMFSLTALSLLALVYMVLSSAHFEMQKYSGPENLGRDFLRLNYREDVPIGSSEFRALAKLNATFLGSRNISFDESMEDFVPRKASNWTLEFGTAAFQWPVNNPLGANGYQAIAPGLSARDYYVEVYVKYTRWDYTASRIGLGVRSSTAGARYMCTINGNAVLEPALKLVKKNDWENWETAGVNVPLALPDTWLRMWINATGSLIQCGINDAASGNLLWASSLTDSSFYSGFPVLEAWSFGGELHFDNFSMVVNDSEFTNASNPGLLLKSVLYNYLAPCNCLNASACIMKNSLRTDGCFRKQESLNNSLKEVYVR
ncbi:MAG TPA: hypothetical protein VJI13_00185 [Candidatus Norongarragalinales archaeon]|nr:hypothetical protein [Candidatus Norongarragalinales archaeon]